MKSFCTEHFQFVNYTEMDEFTNEFIWKTRNMPEVRKYMTNQNIISIQEHNQFVNALQTVDNKQYFSVLQTGGGRYNCIGSVNFVFLGNNTIERGIFIHPYYRGKGLSKIISLELYEYLHKNRDINIVKTKVLKDNKASLALQLSLGAVLEASDERYNYFMLDLTTT